MRIGQKVVREFVNTAKIVPGGQGNLTITNSELWEMPDEEFRRRFVDEN